MRKSRRKAREFALKALYEWIVSGNEVAAITRHLQEQEGFETIDDKYFLSLVNGVTTHAEALRAELTPLLDRALDALSPIENAIMLIGAYEATRCLDVPYRVVVNEAVELAKSYGGTDGHKYVNGVLDKLLAQVRPTEVRSA